MMKLWRADREQLKAIEVECPNGGYPEYDADGKKIYVNTHFETEEEAWHRLYADVLAKISLIGSRIIQIESELTDAQQKSAEAVKAYELLQRNQLKSDRSTGGL